ncbi:MAG: translation elongation factor Ts [Acidimicrobiaceae bacterium]|nr:translation elongation factor Ts [Acidimicrobiaceae bacterium]|tara:strand:- start:9903 stop:10697 length:795 start_codon:yes stop_codon:yes gene_type:complete
MADFTAKDVQALRQSTGAGMMDAKKALVENDGDPEAAAQWLREKGIAKSASRSDRENSEGIVVARVEGSTAAIIELKCETDFVAKSEQFGEMAENILAAVLAQGEDAVSESATDLENMKITLKENIDLGRVIRYEASPGAVLDAYVHQQNGRGVNAVLIEIDNGDPEIAHDVALHIASSRPKYLTRDDVPSEAVAAERETLENITRNEGKPEQAIEKIVDGRMDGFFRDSALLEQKFVKDEKMAISDLLAGSTITRFVQVEIGN